jgi:hypothetical protein
MGADSKKNEPFRTLGTVRIKLWITQCRHINVAFRFDFSLKKSKMTSMVSSFG